MSFERVMAVVASGLIGFAFIARGLYLTSKVGASQNWPHIVGKVVDSTLRKDTGGEGTSYEVDVRYEYVVNGVRYTGRRVAFSKQSYVRSRRAQQEIDRYPANADVTVYFNPEKPDEAVLQREAPNTTLGFAAGGILLAIAVAGCFNL